MKFLPRKGVYTKCPVVGIPVGIFCLFWSSWGDCPGTVVADDDDPTEVVWGVEALLRTMEDPAEPPPGAPLVPRAEAPPNVVKAVLFGEECPIGISIIGLRIIGLSVWIAIGEVRDVAGCCTGLDWLNLQNKRLIKFYIHTYYR